MKTTTSAPRRILSAYRFSPKTKHLLRALAEHLTAKNEVREVTQTEVIERAVHQLAVRENVK